ncbi:hypothetical protein ACVW1C_008099 [Bradyrhizobium sp. USDA 4011]
MSNKSDYSNIVDLAAVRQARQRVAAPDGLRELDDHEMELIGILLDRLSALKAEKELIEQYCDLIEAGGDQFDDAHMEIERLCDLISARQTSADSNINP